MRYWLREDCGLGFDIHCSGEHDEKGVSEMLSQRLIAEALLFGLATYVTLRVWSLWLGRREARAAKRAEHAGQPTRIVQ